MTVAADTNVLLRMVLGDDKDQLVEIERFVERMTGRNETILIGPIVLSELAWTIARRGTKADLVRAIQAFSNAPPFRFFDAGLVEKALADYCASKADFVDCLIGRMNKSAPCRTTVSFDRAACELTTFSHIAELE